MRLRFDCDDVEFELRQAESRASPPCWIAVPSRVLRERLPCLRRTGSFACGWRRSSTTGMFPQAGWSGGWHLTGGMKHGGSRRLTPSSIAGCSPERMTSCGCTDLWRSSFELFRHQPCPSPSWPDTERIRQDSAGIWNQPGQYRTARAVGGLPQSRRRMARHRLAYWTQFLPQASPLRLLRMVGSRKPWVGQKRPRRSPRMTGATGAWTTAALDWLCTKWAIA